MLAYTYPLLNIFWTMFVLFAFVMWIYLLIVIFADIFRSHDMGGWAKALWFLLVLFLPVVGILIYLIARGGGMAERTAAEAQRQQEAFDEYVRRTAAQGDGASADQLSKLADLRDSGKITDEEYAQGKAKILS